jgi:hypothetical protein
VIFEERITETNFIKIRQNILLREEQQDSKYANLSDKIKLIPRFEAVVSTLPFQFLCRISTIL